MPGYLNRFVELELSEYGEGCFVRIHNPKVVPQSMLEPKTRVEVDANGQALDRDKAVLSAREVVAGLIKDWQVYDATCLDDEQPLLTLPATPESVAKLPMTVFLKLQQMIADAIPNPS